VSAEQCDRAVAAVERANEPLQLGRRERVDVRARVGRDLAQRPHRVGRDVPVLDGDLQDSRQARHRLAHGVRRAAVVE
jgi:hypothetical protein